MRHKRKPLPRWWLWLSLWTLIGLAIRLITVYTDRAKPAGGDAYFYHYAANLFVSGHGFLNPYYWFPHSAHHAVQSASFPPLFIFLLAIPSAVGLKTFLAARAWCCMLGAAGIVACGYTGREIGGRRVGLIAAFLLAVYPNIWMTDELALSESIDPLLIALLLLCAYRFWKEPSIKRAIWLGVSLGFAMLGRDELTLLVVVLLVPLILLAKTLSWRRRFAVLGVGLFTVAFVIAPWVGFNMSRFQKPVFISTGLGVTLASADCATTYSGPNEGYWSMPCALAYANQPSVNTKADESVEGAELQHLALNYVRHHENRLLPVTLAKVGRAFGFFHPLQQVQLDSFVETRPYHWALIGLGMYYALFALSIGGAITLRRRRIPSFPLWAIGFDVVCSCALTFGQTRYRTTFEVCLVLMSAVQLERFWSKLRPGRDAAPTSPSGPPAPDAGAGRLTDGQLPTGQLTRGELVGEGSGSGSGSG